MLLRVHNVAVWFLISNVGINLLVLVSVVLNITAEWRTEPERRQETLINLIPEKQVFNGFYFSLYYERSVPNQ